MAKHEAVFEKEKETKNSVRFQEVPAKGKAPIIGSLYVQKHVVMDAEKLKITLEVVE